MSRINWRDEQSVVDAFVEAVHGLNDELIDRVGKVFVRKRFNGDFGGGVEVEDGTLLREDEIPDEPDEHDGLPGLEALDEHLTAERIGELEEGQNLTSTELALWRRLAAEAILTENPDCDKYQLWSVVKVTHSDRRVAFIAILGEGYSFTGASHEYLCGTRTRKEAIAALKSEGYIKVKDFRARWRQRAR